jgi:hypothetical protein
MYLDHSILWGIFGAILVFLSIRLMVDVNFYDRFNSFMEGKGFVTTPGGRKENKSLKYLNNLRIFVLGVMILIFLWMTER